jgi:3-oxoacyl-[acyl-carrier protein] reductase
MAQPRTALVTGAARGIGRATVDALLAAGMRVIALDRDFQGGALVASGPLELVRQDLEDLAAIAPRVASLGRIDVLVNNAGVQNGLPIERYTDEARTRLLRINLEAPVELIRAVSKQMIERRSGRIVNLTSVAAFMPHQDLWYGVSKAGIVSFTRSFAAALGPHGIQVNAVAPGPIETDMLRRAAAPERREQLMKAVYSKRAGRPEEVADVIRWLATDAPVLINGAVIDVTDGSFLR